MLAVGLGSLGRSLAVGPQRPGSLVRGLVGGQSRGTAKRGSDALRGGSKIFLA